ncbi:KilA-N domain-containing protein [Thiorhodococcus mannitoliphagus]|uniref:KilA-N domain-containing protein n=1 Tax=Thiorhodococcus mannitoliphagus TaxID=329406 RepID=A0A6P1E1C9_9GAMM|nr:KilA-N domain-containing protein [Thiorhodococcus mannitoliphagus]
MDLQSNEGLLEEIYQENCTSGIPSSLPAQPLVTINGGNERGTYATKKLVYAYATWISAKFFSHVLDVFDVICVFRSQRNRRIKSIRHKKTALGHQLGR